MKLDFNQSVLNIDGKPIPEQDGGVFTLKKACARALLSKAEGEPTEAAEVQMLNFREAEKIMASTGKHEISDEYAVKILKRLSKPPFGTLVYCRAKIIFDEAMKE